MEKRATIVVLAGIRNGDSYRSYGLLFQWVFGHYSSIDDRFLGRSVVTAPSSCVVVVAQSGCR